MWFWLSIEHLERFLFLLLVFFSLLIILLGDRYYLLIVHVCRPHIYDFSLTHHRFSHCFSFVGLVLDDLIEAVWRFLSVLGTRLVFGFRALLGRHWLCFVLFLGL